MANPEDEADKRNVAWLIQECTISLIGDGRDGRGSVLKAVNGLNGDMIRIKNSTGHYAANGCTFFNVRFDGNKTNQSAPPVDDSYGNGIHIINTGSLGLQMVIMVNCSGNALYHEDTIDDIQKSYSDQIDNVYISDAGLDGVRYTNTTDHQLTNVLCAQNGRNDFSFTRKAADIQCLNCYATGNTVSLIGFYIENVSRIYCNLCVSADHLEDGYKIIAKSTPEYAGFCVCITVIGGDIANNANAHVNLAAFNGQIVRDVKITNSHFVGFRDYDVYIADTNNWQIQSCIISDNNQQNSTWKIYVGSPNDLGGGITDVGYSNIFRNNNKLNPIGVIDNTKRFCHGRTINPFTGTSGNVPANHDFTVSLADLYLTALNCPEGINITVKDRAGNIVVTGLTECVMMFVPVGFTINFGPIATDTFGTLTFCFN
jgi:hypothetical protein